MNYQTLHNRWITVNRMACDAEDRIYRAIETSRTCGTPLPIAEELAQARTLRRIASDYLDASIKEIWRKPD